MVQKLVIYPDERVNLASTDVRSFNQTLWDVLEDMKDTMEANSLTAMAAMQIAYPYNIIIMEQDDGSMKEYINARIIGSYGTFDSVETTLYYPGITQTVPRAPKIKVVYEDRHGKVHYEDMEDKTYAATFQRKADYTYGGTFLDKLAKAQQEAIVEQLKKSGHPPAVEEVCPAFSKKDYFVSFTNKLLFIMFLTLFAPLFNVEAETIETLSTMNYVLFVISLLLMFIFFFYAQYEAKRYRSCTSCQIGNTIGVIIKRVGLGIVLLIANIWILG